MLGLIGNILLYIGPMCGGATLCLYIIWYGVAKTYWPEGVKILVTSVLTIIIGFLLIFDGVILTYDDFEKLALVRRNWP
jgi:hypothetical protein